MHNFMNDALFFLMWLACAQGKDCPNKCVVEWCPTSRYPDFNSYIDLAAKDPDEPESCAKVWCPAVKYTKYNRWLCGAPSDPELMPQETEEVELPNEEPETPQVEDTPTTEKEDKPTDNEETKKVTPRPFKPPPELFAGLVHNPPHGVVEFGTEATTIEKELQQRAPHYNRDVTSAPADLLSAGPGSNTVALRELVPSIVKEALRKLQLPVATPTVSTLAAVIRHEVCHAILQPRREEPPTCADVR
nr:uncharacterized protein LOC129383124 [Dermacentor andersoni]